MAENEEQKGEKADPQMDIKVEPTLQCYVEEGHENGFSNFENTSSIPSTADVGALNLWTSKATTCLITQYKKYRSMVGQSTQIRSLREMFEMISHEMQKYGFSFSPQKCENKWRVLERKYKNLVFRERLKKPGRMRHYGHWEHKRALDEIFNEKRRHMYLDDDEYLLPGFAKYVSILPKQSNEENKNEPSSQQPDVPRVSIGPNSPTSKKAEEISDHQGSLSTLFEKFFGEMLKNFDVAEKNREQRHKEKMAMRQNELEVQKRILKLKEQKLELQKCQIIASAQHVHLNM